MKIARKIKLFLKETPHIWLALFYPAFVIVFFALEAYVPSADSCWIVHSPLDDAIPFLEVFVIPYVLWYPFLAATPIALLAARDDEGFRKHLYFMMLGFGAALVFCFIVPNAQLMRPAEMPRDNFLTAIVTWLYEADTPTNVFPSMHVIGCIAGAAACLHSPALKKLRPAWVIIAVLISASTVFIKQHSILDVFGAIIFCVPIWLWLYAKRERKARNEGKKGDAPAAEGNNQEE